MPKITIQPTARTVEEILSGPSYYRIPRFQRPFSWESEHIDEFWNDAIQNRDEGYFIGPMVVYKEDARDWGIVDGQQRLTAIALILAALRDNLEALGEDVLADAAHRFVERPDPDGKDRFVLQSDVEEGRWIHAIQQRRSESGQPQKKDFDAPAWSAFSIISDRIAAFLADSAGSKTGARRKTAEVKALRSIRDQLLGLTVIWVPLDSEDDAYEIFETLNARGKDLELSDRLKNFFLSNLRAGNANVDDYRWRWNVVRQKFDGEPSTRDLERFIQHWWISRAKYVAERKVFSGIKRTVKRKDVPAVFAEFEADADRYRTIVAPDDIKWTVEKHAVRDSLQALQLMRLAQPMPFVLAVMRTYAAKKLPLRNVVAALQTIENYHFQVTAISTKSSSGGVSEMYASHARQLTEATNARERKEQVSALQTKLIERRPSRSDFVEAFESRLVFAEKYQRDKKLVQYVLRRLHEHHNPNPAADFSKFSIEHLVPQSKIHTDDDLALIGGIGNLFYLDDSLNLALGDKRFSDKKRILKKHASNYDLGDVLVAKKWGEEQVRERARRLGGDAYDTVWQLGG